MSNQEEGAGGCRNCGGEIWIEYTYKPFMSGWVTGYGNCLACTAYHVVRDCPACGADQTRWVREGESDEVPLCACGGDDRDRRRVWPLTWRGA